MVQNTTGRRKKFYPKNFVFKGEAWVNVGGKPTFIPLRKDRAKVVKRKYHDFSKIDDKENNSTRKLRRSEVQAEREM